MRLERMVLWMGCLAVAGCAASVDGGTGSVSDATRTRTGGGGGAGGALLGINIDPRNPAAAPTADDLRALGATRVRIELKVPNGLAEAFAFYDPVIDSYGARGIETLFIVDYATVDRGALDFGTYVGRFSDAATAIAGHYAGRVHLYEVWNEEDVCTPNYCPHVGEGDYATLLATAADAIHGAAPGSTVMLGGLGAGQVAYLRNVRAAIGAGWDSVDAVAVHPYVKWPSEGGAHGQASMPRFMDSMASAGGKPLVLTEWGIPDGSLEPQLVRDFFAFFSQQPDRAGLSGAFFFGWSDAQDPGFGLFTDAGEKKPAWQEFHDAAATLGPRSDGKTPRLHGTVLVAGERARGLQVTAGGHDAGDFHVTTTDALGIFAFTDLDPASQYNVVVNADFTDGGFRAVDGAHDFDVHNNVDLIAGPDGWHGDNFQLAR